MSAMRKEHFNEQQNRLHEKGLAKGEELRVKEQREHDMLFKACEKDAQEPEEKRMKLKASARKSV